MAKLFLKPFFVYTLKTTSGKEHKIIMKELKGLLLLTAFVLLALATPSFAQTSRNSLEIIPSKNYKPLRTTESETLKKLVDEAIKEVIAANETLKPDDIAATVIDLSDAENIVWANSRGEAKIYPASVVKLFYLAALHRQLQDKKITLSTELERGMRDMIVDSSNEATQYILDVLTDTSSGAEMPQKQFDKWQYKRNRVNRYFAALGYTNINVNQKTFCEDAYGIEQQSRGYEGKNRNMLTTNAAARLIAEIAMLNMVTPERSREMLELLKREPFKKGVSGEGQATEFSGMALIERNMTDAKLWSKAGWTSSTRHDAAVIELPNGTKFAVAVFTERNANNKKPIAQFVGKIIDELGK